VAYALRQRARRETLKEPYETRSPRSVARIGDCILVKTLHSSTPCQALLLQQFK
jgi:hypothetical protein